MERAKSKNAQSIFSQALFLAPSQTGSHSHTHTIETKSGYQREKINMNTHTVKEKYKERLKERRKKTEKKIERKTERKREKDSVIDQKRESEERKKEGRK